VDDDEWLADRFEAHRGHLTAVAYRMLGSRSEADDAVQESWLRLSRADTSEVRNLGGWLTTVVARVCLDMLRSRTTRREDPLDDAGETDAPVGAVTGPDPEREAVLADSVGLALLVVLDTLGPAERLAFVLHDMFAVPFDEIAPIVGRTTNATKMMASRARRRVQSASPDGTGGGAERRRDVVAAFLAASRDGDFEALVSMLHPDAVLRADDAAVATGVDAEVVGARGVATMFAGRARAARLALVDGVPALVWAQRGETRVVFGFTVVDGRIAEVDISADPEYVAGIDVEVLG
jgi:RNA polymerase sigma factor (sigma-70 family)